MQLSDPQIIAMIAALAPFLVSLATYLYKLSLSRLPQNKQALLMNVAQTAVQAAEQMGNGAAGTAKKKLAENATGTALKSLGLAINPVFIDAAIESLVFAMNQNKNTLNVPQSGSDTHING